MKRPRLPLVSPRPPARSSAANAQPTSHQCLCSPSTYQYAYIFVSDVRSVYVRLYTMHVFNCDLCMALHALVLFVEHILYVLADMRVCCAYIDRSER